MTEPKKSVITQEWAEATAQLCGQVTDEEDDLANRALAAIGRPTGKPLKTTPLAGPRANLQVGDMMRVKAAIWQEWCIRNQVEYRPAIPQPITNLPSHPPYQDYLMLAHPFYWWKLEDLEPA